MREREAQIGFVEGLDELRGFDTLIVHRDSIVVVVAGEHRWSRRRLITAKDLAREPYITRELVFALCELVCGGLRAQMAELDEILAAGVT